MKTRFHIYCITNKVNGKRYVGQTVNAVETRWKEHVTAAVRRTVRGGRVFSKAIRKYGADSFTHELLDVVTTQRGADIAETRWIEQRQSRVPNGYNLAAGGGGNGHHHEESKRLIGEASKKYWRTVTPEKRIAHLQAIKWTPGRKALATAEGPRLFWEKLSPEERAERHRNRWVGKTPEQRTLAMQKMWATRRAKYGQNGRSKKS